MNKVYDFPFEILNKAILNNKISNAYLFSGDKESKKMDMAKYFAKMIFCFNKKDGVPCNECFACKSISDLKIIDSENKLIKKEEILLLKEEFSKKSLNGNKRMYIINNSDKLNDSASNSLLKFLEEPEEDIVAVLITDNVNKLLPTIRSRCQTIIFSNKSSYDNKLLKIADIINLDGNSERFFDFVDNVILFLKSLDENKIRVFSEENKKYIELFQNKERFNYAVNVMIYFYLDVINFYHINEFEIFEKHKDYVVDLINKRDINILINRLNKFIEIEERIDYNVNLNLLLDRLILEF